MKKLLSIALLCLLPMVGLAQFKLVLPPQPYYWITTSENLTNEATSNYCPQSGRELGPLCTVEVVDENGFVEYYTFMHGPDTMEGWPDVPYGWHFHSFEIDVPSLRPAHQNLCELEDGEYVCRPIYIGLYEGTPDPWDKRTTTDCISGNELWCQFWGWLPDEHEPKDPLSPVGW